MDTRHIHYFMAVYEHLHFTKAAEALGISQPTLSQQIRVLEAELGMPLFDRIGKQVVATEAGKLLRLHGGRMLHAEQDAKVAIRELMSSARGTVRICVLPSDLDFQLVPLFIHFHSEYPDIQLQAFSTIHILEEVLNNRVDIGIALRSPRDKRLVQIPLRSEPYHLLVHSGSELADRTSILLHELEHIPLVLYPQGFLGRDLVEKVCREQGGFQLSTVMETSTAISLLQLVRAGVGATIQPESLLKQESMRNDIIAIPISDHPPMRHLELIYGSDRYISSAHNQLTKWLIDFFSY
ncbi:LysR family transcriptional regulator [Paenibacillus paeoniae]|uniref:LysR family transcriptional regulator n=1 Tax=Paenibacillus paeoniae TaxID=2292705 RepID=A0A371PN98_9BACL|nr:LysR family transcriptional regulator [Paenibacillus paeoniae]REK77651.1 LysR family transcriptional regulator [Paenibacillus paeoniae]